MTRRQPRFNRSLRCESLEPRRMLAGDVTAKVNNQGHLIITGDAQSNAIQIEAGLLPGQYTITGLPDDQNVGTTVNHGGSVTVSGVTGDIRIQLNAGNDWLNVGLGGPLSVAGDLRIGTDVGDDMVQISNVTVGGSAVIQLGDGSDALQLSSSSVVGDVTINGGGPGTQEASPGHLQGDVVELANTPIGGSLEIRTGSGVDEIDVDYSSLHAPVSIGGHLLISSGGDTDIVNLRGGNLGGTPDGSAFTGGDVTITLGAGDDMLQTTMINVTGNVDIRGGDGADTINLDQQTTVHGTTFLAGNAGADQIIVSDSSTLIGDLTVTTAGDGDFIGLLGSTFGNVTITTGAGDDFIFISGSHFTGNVTFDLGGGNDTFHSEDSVYDHVVSILMGAGDDQTELLNNTFLGPTTMDGGKGADNLDDQGGNTFGDTSTITHYES